MAKLIDPERYKTILQRFEEHLTEFGKLEAAEAVRSLIKGLQIAPTVDAVEMEKFNTLKNLVNGEWVDCKLVQEALCIDFATGLKMFQFSRTVEWNPAPLNGQKITTKFRLKNAVEVVHGRWIEEIEKNESFESEMVKCSLCGQLRFFESNYCPNCGADMREVSDA